MSNILALDQASHVSGYAVFSPEGKLLKHGKFSLDQPDIGDRLVELRITVADLIKDNDVDYVVMEDIQQQGNVTTFKVLAEVFGVLEEFLTEIEMPHQAVLAATWKSTLKIKGRTRPEQKRNAQAYVAKEYGVKATQDECDAICIGTHYIFRNTSAF